MRLPTIFKQHKNKSFDYYPRYYDERKERLEKLYEKHHGTKDMTDEERVLKRRESFRDSWYKNRQAQVKSNANKRLGIILVALFGLAFFIIKYYRIAFF